MRHEEGKREEAGHRGRWVLLLQLLPRKCNTIIFIFRGLIILYDSLRVVGCLKLQTKQKDNGIHKYEIYIFRATCNFMRKGAKTATHLALSASPNS